MLVLENIPLVAARKYAEKLRSEAARPQGLIDQYGLQDVAALDDLKRHLNQEVDGVRGQFAAASAELSIRQADIAATEASLLDLRGAVEVQERRLYDYEHPAEDSVALATQLEALRADIKTAVRSGRATQATSNFTFNSSTAKRLKFVRDMSKLMLRSYNAEARPRREPGHSAEASHLDKIIEFAAQKTEDGDYIEAGVQAPRATQSKRRRTTALQRVIHNRGRAERNPVRA